MTVLSPSAFTRAWVCAKLAKLALSNCKVTARGPLLPTQDSRSLPGTDRTETACKGS